MIENYADKQHKQCKLLIQKWQILREIVYVLQIPLRATVAVQRHDMTLSDVFGIWKIMELHLAACKNKSNYKTSLAKYLCETVEGKKDVMYSNPFMTCQFFSTQDSEIILHQMRISVKKPNARYLNYGTA